MKLKIHKNVKKITFTIESSVDCLEITRGNLCLQWGHASLWSKDLNKNINKKNEIKIIYLDKQFLQKVCPKKLWEFKDIFCLYNLPQPEVTGSTKIS